MRKRLFCALAAVGLSTSVAMADLPNGVASGDVTQTSAVLWARGDGPGTVTFEYSTDPTFSSGVQSVGVTVSNPLVPAKLPLAGLTPNTTYYVRASHGAELATGEFKTPANVGVQTGLRIAVLSDWQQAPPYPAVRNVPDRAPDLILKLGDTIYADLETPASSGFSTPSQARTLEEFRIKHEEVISGRSTSAGDFTNFMRDIYAEASLLSTIDDHEIVDNFAGGAAPGDSPDAPDIGSSNERLFTDGTGATIGSPVPASAQFVNETTVYQEAMQAYEEYHPIDAQIWTGTVDPTDGIGTDPRMEGKPKLYRHVHYGSDATVTMLDSRSFRDDQLDPPSDVLNAAQVEAFFIDASDPNRTLLGRSQVEQLKADLFSAQQAGTTWKFVSIPEPIQQFGIVNAEDRYEGYAAERSEILGFIDQAGIENVVFLSGDFHGNIVNDLSYQIPDGIGGLTDVRTNAFEVVTGPISFFDGRFGPNVAEIAFAAGFIDQPTFNAYLNLPIDEDTNSTPDDRDDFIKQLVNEQIALTSLGGANPIGLSDSSLIDATLIEGDYLAAHRFQWTELEIDPVTQRLTVTTWGIDAFSEQETIAAIVNGDLSVIEDRTPQIVSRFIVNPIPEPASFALLAVGALGLIRRARRVTA